MKIIVNRSKAKSKPEYFDFVFCSFKIQRMKLEPKKNADLIQHVLDLFVVGYKFVQVM